MKTTLGAYLIFVFFDHAFPDFAISLRTQGVTMKINPEKTPFHSIFLFHPLHPLFSLKHTLFFLNS
jgi:hypothetical protein